MDNKTKYFVTVSVVVIGLLSADMVICGLFDGQPIAGPMDIVIKSLETCPKRMRGEDGLRFRNTSGFHLKERPSEFFLTSDVSLDFPVDDSLTAELRFAQWTNRGVWKNGMKDMKLPRLCSAMSQYAGEMWENILIQIYGEKIPCPVPAKQHVSLHNMSINTKYIRLREFLYGKWRGDFLLLQGTKTKACIRIYTDVSPAVSQKST